MHRGGDELDRAFRILSIYNRLLQHKQVNKKSLTIEFNASPRTIQRDIDDIRNFLYENKSWINTTPDEITYDYTLESYRLKHTKNKSKDKHFMFNILTALHLTTPSISHSFYHYLKSLIFTQHSDNQYSLLKYLEKLTVDENISNITQTSLVVRALNENKYLKYDNNLILPLSISYLMYPFHLIYLLNNNVHMTDINALDVTLTNQSFDESQKEKKNILVTFEVTKLVFQTMQKHHQVHVIESHDNDHLIVTFNITRLEAIQLCFLYRSNIRIISPSDLKEEMIDEIISLQSTYLKQRIGNRNYSDERTSNTE